MAGRQEREDRRQQTGVRSQERGNRMTHNRISKAGKQAATKAARRKRRVKHNRRAAKRAKVASSAARRSKISSPMAGSRQTIRPMSHRTTKKELAKLRPAARAALKARRVRHK